MNKNQTSISFSNSLWDFFSAVKLSVVVLLTLAVTSIIGTVIPQNGDPALYKAKYGEALYRVFDIFNVFDMYHSGWFRALIVILTLNIVICSINRLKSSWKIIFVKNPKFNLTRFKKLKKRQEFTVSTHPENLEQSYEKIVSKRFGYHRVEKEENGFSLFAEKGRWTRLGVYFVHLSIILLLIGSMVGSFWGFDGYANIREGKAINSIGLRNSQKIQDLGFTLKCNDFDVTFYESGMPKQFKSNLSIIENNKTVLNKNIIVNDPLRYKGINMFQSSYGPDMPKDINVKFTIQKTGKVYEEKGALGKVFKLPENLGKFIIQDLHKSYKFMGRNIGSAFTGLIVLNDNTRIDVLIPFPFPKFDANSPMRSKTLDMFQTTKSGTDKSEEILISITNAKTGMVYTKKARLNEPIDIPEGGGEFVLTDFVNSFDFRGQQFDEEAFKGKLTPQVGNPIDIIIPPRFPGFDKMRGGKVVVAIKDFEQNEKNEKESGVIVSVTDFEQGYYTGLQITSDPGVPIVYAGFIIMILGCYVTFFMSHKSLCIHVSRDKENTPVLVSGTANKNKLEMENQVKKIATKLANVT
jgi:cytochrome c biogenesis protein